MENSNNDVTLLLTSLIMFNGASAEIEPYHRTLWLLTPFCLVVCFDFLLHDGRALYVNQVNNETYTSDWREK